MIDRIERSVIWHGREKGITWFHPRACFVPACPNPYALMTCQSISGSDLFGQVHWSVTEDGGKTWTDPQPIPAFCRHAIDGGIEEGVCDVVPEYHPHTDTVLAMGHNVYCKDNALTRPSEERFIVYAVRDSRGAWSDLKALAWDDPRASRMYTCGCAQRVTLENGDIVIPVSFVPRGREDRGVGSVICAYDGEVVRIIASGNELRLPIERGLLEPSIVRFGGKFYMTIRAEDGCGYASVSDDGLHWEKQTPWRWDDGEPLTMSTTQQRWLPHSDALFLVYTRKAENNVNVMRWRAPLFVAEVDCDMLRLKRDTEQVVLPLIGDGINDSDHVARMGNFHTTVVSERESWVTVGETLPQDSWRGDTLMARILWKEPNHFSQDAHRAKKNKRDWRTE